MNANAICPINKNLILITEGSTNIGTIGLYKWYPVDNIYCAETRTPISNSKLISTFSFSKVW